MNPEQHVTATPTAAALPPGEEPMIDQLLRRVQSLEEEKRRWKTIGIISLALLVLVGGTAVVGLAAISSRYQQQKFQALEQAEMAAREAEQARLRAEFQRVQDEVQRRAAEAQLARQAELEAQRLLQEAERQRAKANEK